MHKILIALLVSFISHSAFSQATCPDQQQLITQSLQEIKAIHIPEITYTVNEYNCSQVKPVLNAISLVLPKQFKLLEQYQIYYQTCDRSIDIVYAMEDTKINIILLQTLEDLAHNLTLACGATR